MSTLKDAAFGVRPLIVDSAEHVPLSPRPVLSAEESLCVAEAFRDRLATRRSVRMFDPTRPVADAVVAACV